MDGIWLQPDAIRIFGPRAALPGPHVICIYS
jgi:hypothetical protein